MIIKQISVFIENKPGRLVEVTKVLKKNNIDIRSLSVADTTKFGILRMIVNNPDLAEKALKAEGFTVSVTEVLAIGVNDEPGGLNKVLEILDQYKISVEYMYAFIGRSHQNAVVIIRTDDRTEAIDALLKNGCELLRSDAVYGI